MRDIVTTINESLVNESRIGEWFKAMNDAAKRSVKDIKNNFKTVNYNLHQKWDAEDAIADRATKLRNLPANIKSLYDYFMKCSEECSKDKGHIEDYYSVDDFNKLCKAICDVNDIEIAMFVIPEMIEGPDRQIRFMLGYPGNVNLPAFKDRWDYYVSGIKMLIKKYPKLDE